MAGYRQALEPLSELGDRVRLLARLRTGEGYMAEVETQEDGTFLLIENHCPICTAAEAYQEFCHSELEMFEAALGACVSVSQEHLLAAVHAVASIASHVWRPRDERPGDQAPIRVSVLAPMIGRPTSPLFEHPGQRSQLTATTDPSSAMARASRSAERLESARGCHST